MFKRVISLLLVFSIIFTFASCVKEKEVEETTTQIPTVKVTIPEGYTLLRISWLLEEKGLCTSDEFINLAQTYDEWIDFTQYPFLEDLKNIYDINILHEEVHWSNPDKIQTQKYQYINTNKNKK